MPPVNQGLMDGELAWRQHDGGHTDAPNVKYFVAWADKVMGRPVPDVHSCSGTVQRFEIVTGEPGAAKTTSPSSSVIRHFMSLIWSSLSSGIAYRLRSQMAMSARLPGSRVPIL